MSEGTDGDVGSGPPASIGVLEVLAVPGTGCWSVRVTVAHAEGPISGWVPSLLGDPAEAEAWLSERSGRQLRPAVRRCLRDDRLAYAVVLDEGGAEIVVSAPVRRIKAAGVAALLTAELRART